MSTLTELATVFRYTSISAADDVDVSLYNNNNHHQPSNGVQSAVENVTFFWIVPDNTYGIAEDS